MVARPTSIAEAREQLPTLVHQAELGVPTTLTRRGKPVAVLVSTSAYARLTGQQRGFFDVLDELRATPDFAALDLAGALDHLRDPAAGREPVLP